MFGFGTKKRSRRAFLETASAFLQAGWPAPESFALACAAGYRAADGNARWSHTWCEVEAQLAAGGSLGECLGHLPDVFTAAETAAVVAAEQDGSVMLAIGRLAGQTPPMQQEDAEFLKAEAVRMRTSGDAQQYGEPVSQQLTDGIVADFTKSDLDALVMLHSGTAVAAGDARTEWIAAAAPLLPDPFGAALCHATLTGASPDPNDFPAAAVAQGEPGAEGIGTTVILGIANGGYALRMELPGVPDLARRVVRRVAWRTNTDYWIQHETGPIPLDRETVVAADWRRHGDPLWLLLQRPAAPKG